MYLNRFISLTLLVEVQGLVRLPDVVGYLTDPVAWWRGQKLNEPLVHQPKKLMPTVHTLQHMTEHESEERFHFFMALFFLIFFTTIIVGTGIMVLGPCVKTCLDCGYQPLSSSRSGRVSLCSSASESSSRSSSVESEEVNDVGLDLESQRVYVTIAFGSTLLACGATGIWSLATDTLSTNTGLDWEMYALLFAGGGIGVLIQAIFAVKWLPKGQTFGIFAFAEGAFVSLAPFISDSFDTLKDIIFCCLCFESQFLVLKVIGAMSWLYLVAIHIYFIRRDDTLAELAGCYLPVLGALPRSEVPEENSCCETGWNTVLLLLYKHTTPTKRKLLLIENLPQALFSIVFLNLEGGSLFVKVINLGMPAAQISATFVFFRPLLNLVGPQLGNKLSSFLKKPDFLKAKQLWDEAFRRDLDLLERALPKLLKVPLVKDLLQELKPRKEDAELDLNTDEGLHTFGLGLEVAIEFQGDLRNVDVPDAVAAKRYPDTDGICRAVAHGDVAAVRGHVRTNPSAVDFIDAGLGYTALHLAARHGHREIAQVLLTAKASVEARDQPGNMPLHLAARDGHLELVRLLVAAKAPLDAQGNRGKTPLQRAEEKCHHEVAEFLRAAASQT